MVKKKQKRQPKVREDQYQSTLGNILGEQLQKQLKDKKKQLKEVEEQRKEAELERKREEQRLREKNKSFEELLEDSQLNWKDYK